MEAGSLVEWLKKDGDPVKPGDMIARIEGDKAIDEVEAFDEGVLRIPPSSPEPGAKVPVGTLLAYLVQPGERAPFESEEVRSGASPVSVGVSAGVTSDGNGSVSTATPATRSPEPSTQNLEPSTSPAISPRARRIAAELGVTWTNLRGSGRTGRIVERDVRQAAARPPLPEAATETARISPLARRIAEEAGLDIDEIARTRPGQRITRADVEEAARARAAAGSATPSSSTGRAGEGLSPVPAAPDMSAPAAAVTSLHTTPMSGVRQLIATRLAESAHTVAPVTLTTEADATDLVRLREQIKTDLAGSDLPVPSYNDLLAKLVAVALGEHPALNASLVGSEIVQHAAVNVGLAVDSERGLLVPVVRDVQAKSVQQIASEAARLIQSARSGHVSPDDLRGGTFTITNLGMYDIDAFTPIINLPEAAILGVGRIVARPVVVDEATDKIAVRKMLALSLTFDHRLVDGAPAARFLQRVKHFVEHPTLWLIR
jgi:pyruvate dehydrogenase E2 component (dihydrolipoamide acetyltransferase)